MNKFQVGDRVAGDFPDTFEVQMQYVRIHGRLQSQNESGVFIEADGLVYCCAPHSVRKLKSKKKKLREWWIFEDFFGRFTSDKPFKGAIHVREVVTKEMK